MSPRKQNRKALKPPSASENCFVYILGSFDKNAIRTYVGWTNNLERRLAAHNNGSGARSTRGRMWALLYAERHETKNAAMSREWHLKRDRKFRKMVCGEN
jgi:putative endonuclease